MTYLVRVVDPKGDERCRKTFTEPPSHVRVADGDTVELIDVNSDSPVPVTVETDGAPAWDHDWSLLDA